VYAAYPRVSDDEQNKGNSPERQLERIHQWAEQQGMKLGEYRADDRQKYPWAFQEDYTGTEYERPEMDRIRRLAEQGVINAVVVSHTDRFARDEAVFLLLERFFKKHNVRLFSVEEGEFAPGTVNRFVAAIQRAKAERANPQTASNAAY
jgi:DNA invertase Pin-like site-specific DNA recombinase